MKSTVLRTFIALVANLCSGCGGAGTALDATVSPMPVAAVEPLTAGSGYQSRAEARRAAGSPTQLGSSASSASSDPAGCDAVAPSIQESGTVVSAGTAAIRRMTPQFFGFNIPIIEFQRSLWDSRTKTFDSNAVAYLKRLPGAVYRYPGGTEANYFDWQASIGALETRRPQLLVDWEAPKPVEVGPTEYLEFVRMVGGAPWYVLNIFGTYGREAPSATIATSAAELVSYMNGQRERGLPSVLRWELGNELDRGRAKWQASKYASVAQETVAAIWRVSPESAFVGMTQDWPTETAPAGAASYNSTVASSIGNMISQYAAHLYYDGAPWGPPVPQVLAQLCKNSRESRLGSPGSSVWITEHGRTPTGTPADSDWNKNWPQTANLGAAISVSDMMISLARSTAANGAFIHALHAMSGPWPIFHKSGGIVYPSAVYWGLVMLRESMLDEALQTNVITTNRGGDKAGYDVNAAIFASSNRAEFSVWIVNRGSQSAEINLRIPTLAGLRVQLKAVTLTGGSLSASNYTGQTVVTPSSYESEASVRGDGSMSVSIPEYSVVTARLIPISN